MRDGDFVYDLECLPNLFIAGFAPLLGDDHTGYIFEISERRNDCRELLAFLSRCGRLFGFNNMAYDWPMLHHFMGLMQYGGAVTAEQMYAKNQEIFSTGFENRFQHIIWQPAVPQIDMFLMHHMDRFSVGLKQTEFNMRSQSVMDMPIAPGTRVTPDQIDMIIGYNIHDIRETKRFVIKSKADIEFRETLGPEWLNYNDGKIGKKFFENKLRAAGVQLYENWSGSFKGKKRSTPRLEGVRLADVILPFIQFTRGALQVQLERFREETVMKIEVEEGLKKKERMLRPDGTEIKYVFDLDGFAIDVRLGGIHGSVEKRVVTATPNGRIRDFDVTSYYPSIAIVHRIYPLHLGPAFCDVYADLKRQRVALSKDDPARTTLKFALNVPFGDSNNRHGIFFDPAYMLAITVNGQLMLCMLAEALANIPGVELIQVNTDGVTVVVPPAAETLVKDVTAWWQRLTGMDLEEVEYRRMIIRDANNYIAEGVDGKRKRKGAYEYKKNWRQDHSELIVPRAAEAAMLDDCDPEQFIREHEDAWDFLLFRKGRMELNTGEKLPKNIRYYISATGSGLMTIHAPLKGKTEPRRIGVHAEGLASPIPIMKEGRKTPIGYHCSECGERFDTKGLFEAHNKNSHCWKVRVVNVFDGKMPEDIDYRYYLKEVEKLLID